MLLVRDGGRRDEEYEDEDEDEEGKKINDFWIMSLVRYLEPKYKV